MAAIGDPGRADHRPLPPHDHGAGGHALRYPRRNPRLRSRAGTHRRSDRRRLHLGDPPQRPRTPCVEDGTRGALVVAARRRHLPHGRCRVLPGAGGSAIDPRGHVGRGVGLRWAGALHPHPDRRTRCCCRCRRGSASHPRRTRTPGRGRAGRVVDASGAAGGMGGQPAPRPRTPRRRPVGAHRRGAAPRSMVAHA